jgi:hypothetical protein
LTSEFFFSTKFSFKKYFHTDPTQFSRKNKSANPSLHSFSLILFLLSLFLALSFNQPKFCPTASWNSNGITFANQSIVGAYPLSVFVNTNNTIYVVNQEKSTTLV